MSGTDAEQRKWRPSAGRVVAVLSLAGAAALVAIFVLGTSVFDLALRKVERRHLERLAETREMTAREYAWWDDTWDFIDRPSGPAAERFIRDNYVDWIPRQYGERVMAIWARDRRLVWSWADPEWRGAEAGIAAGGLFDFLDRRRSVGGLLRTDRGLFLVAASVVVRSSDQTGLGPWHGYLVFANPMTDELSRRIGAELQEDVHVLPADSGAAWSVASRRSADKDSLETSLLVPDIYGRTAAELRMAVSRASFNELDLWTDSVFTIGFLVIGAILVALWVVAQRVVVRPLRDTAGALEAMQASRRLGPISLEPPSREWALFATTFNQTVAALRASEERYRLLFDAAADALFLLDEQGGIVEANPAAERLAAAGAAELAGRRLADLFEPPLAGRVEAGATYRLRRPDGSTVMVGVLEGAVAIGAAPHRLAAVRDLSERENLEAQLRQAQKMEALGALAGGIAHDFNNLVGAVLVSTANLKQDLGPAHASLLSVETIERASRRAADLTRQLLSFARRDRMRVASVNLVDVVKDIGRICERTFDRAISVETRAPVDVVLVHGDAGQLEQALLNLCINARDAMPSGGTLTLEVDRRELDEAASRALQLDASGAYAMASVADSGVGMKPEVQRRLFEPFFTTKEQGKGTGLGLAMAYGIIRAHRGGIAVRSAPGRGTRFDLYLPVAATDARAPVGPAPGGGAPGGTETVLLVDDEADLRGAMALALRRLGYQVIEADNGRSGLERLREHSHAVRLVVLDLIMPEMGGVEAFSRMRALKPDVPILLCSGFSAAADVQDLLNRGASGFLPKPFDLSDLAREVRQALDHAAQAAPLALEPRGAP
jgi:PAS domain S-box-containing protein